MRTSLVLTATLWVVAALAGEPAREERIRAVIGQQLDAIQRHDAEGAFALASPAIQAMFRTPDNFLRMVEKGYPQIYRLRSASFLELFDEDGRLMQKVLVQSKDGKFVMALYEMVEIEGHWRVNGCMLAVPPADET
ncbi:MAG: DUF4864 domain-containing protein [Candidatus Binatia bacterium]